MQTSGSLAAAVTSAPHKWPQGSVASSKDVRHGPFTKGWPTFKPSAVGPDIYNNVPGWTAQSQHREETNFISGYKRIILRGW